MLSRSECTRVAEFLQGLANPARVKILCALREGEKSVGEIVRETGEKQSNVSQQLQVLLHKGYLSRRRAERNIFYAIKKPELFALMEQVRALVLAEGQDAGEVGEPPAESTP
ncbi:MAG: hypothetical protein PWQ18_1206 [Clostridia bacterium]|nr:hypothetical protein [Clostridia bacterium]